MENFNRDKMMAMIHYIADVVPSAMLGKTKLTKILWFSDKEMYLKSGHTISGETYLKYPRGPLSKHFLEVVDELVNSKKLLVKKNRVIDYEQFVYISLTTPNISLFSVEEIDIIGRQIAWIAPLKADEISEISHGRAWEIADFNEEIPMYSVLIEKTRDLTPEDLKWALAEA